MPENQPSKVSESLPPDTTTSVEPNLTQVEDKIENATTNVVSASEQVPDTAIKNTLDGIAASLMEVKTSIEGLGAKVEKALPHEKKEEKKPAISPKVEVDNQVKYNMIRKRGGRLVRRKAK